MLDFLTSKIMNQVIVPGSLFWRREKRALIRRWRRAMLLPETILLAGLIVFSSYASDHFDFHPGQRALAAANTVIQDGVPASGLKRRQRALQERLRAHPEDLLRLTSGDVMDIFHSADLQRRDGATTILQFRGEQCVLDIFLNDTDPVHYEFRARRQDNAGIEAGRCMDDILQTR
jgi:hypothetical protein